MIKFEQAYQEIKNLIANEIFTEIISMLEKEVAGCDRNLENIELMADYDVLYAEGRRSAFLETLNHISRFKRNVWSDEYD